MTRIILFLVFTSLGVVFVVQNSERVSIQLIIGNPISIRLVFLLLIFFALGYFRAKWENLHRERKLRRELTRVGIR